ncbi:MAG: non-canonical purine NTP pyrophosphatase, partial [Candidatus Poribacteria bacterium]
MATRNLGKVRELGEMLSDQRKVEILSLGDFPDAPQIVEDGETYQENAKKKATQMVGKGVTPGPSNCGDSLDPSAGSVRSDRDVPLIFWFGPKKIGT